MARSLSTTQPDAVRPLGWVAGGIKAPMARADRRAQPSPDESTPAVPASVATGVPTMRDVAKATRVSQSTVSRILSDAPTAIPIAAATRARVLETAKRLGYRPNPLARGLMGARTMLLGAIIRDITDPSFPAIIEAVTTEARRHGYNVVLGHAQGSAGEAVELWAVLESRHCDAILLLGDLSNQPALIEDLQGTREPVVALWHGSRSTVIPTVNVNNRGAITTVMEHLVSLGHERIAFVGRKQLGDIVERADAYEAYLVRQGRQVRPEYMPDAPNEYEGGIEGAAPADGPGRAPHGRGWRHRRPCHRRGACGAPARAPRARGCVGDRRR